MRGKVLTVMCAILLVAMPITLLLVSCGGGGSGGSQSTTGSSGSGSVALLLADGPADDYDQIFITITEVSLIPQEGRGRSPVVIFRNSAGIEVDLLDLRDEDYLLTVNRRVPAGVYEKIRLQISGIRPAGGPCDSLRLPSGKIDLNPRGLIEVALIVHYQFVWTWTPTNQLTSRQVAIFGRSSLLT